MKFHNLILILLTIFLFNSCGKKTTDPSKNEVSNLSIKFKNQISGLDIIQGQFNYTNAAGNLYSVDLLKYYITNVTLIKDDGTSFKLNNYDLINAFDASYSSVEASNVPNGNYTSMQFDLGIDSTRNHTGAQDGDLDPALGMIWTWNTGYIFFKHEGNYKDGSNATMPLMFHLGTDAGLSSIQIPISLNLSGATKTMNIVFDLNKMYSNPITDFNLDNQHQSGATDSKWIADMVFTSKDAFSFLSVN